MNIFLIQINIRRISFIEREKKTGNKTIVNVTIGIIKKNQTKPNARICIRESHS